MIGLLLFLLEIAPMVISLWALVYLYISYRQTREYRRDDGD